mgnify:CR=1 FL=1
MQLALTWALNNRLPIDSELVDHVNTQLEQVYSLFFKNFTVEGFKERIFLVFSIVLYVLHWGDAHQACIWSINHVQILFSQFILWPDTML